MPWPQHSSVRYDRRGQGRPQRRDAHYQKALAILRKHGALSIIRSRPAQRSRDGLPCAQRVRAGAHDVQRRDRQPAPDPRRRRSRGGDVARRPGECALSHESTAGSDGGTRTGPRYQEERSATTACRWQGRRSTSAWSTATARSGAVGNEPGGRRRQTPTVARRGTSGSSRRCAAWPSFASGKVAGGRELISRQSLALALKTARTTQYRDLTLSPGHVAEGPEALCRCRSAVFARARHPHQSARP